MARVTNKGSTYRVGLGEDSISRFRSRWPASNLGDLKRASFEFERRSGDLVDTSCNGRSCSKFDGEALAALSQDAQCIGERRARPKPEHAPRCSGSDWKNLLGGRRGPLTGAAKGAAAAPERCRTGLSTCMKSAAKVGDARKRAGAAICMREFNRCRRM